MAVTYFVANHSHKYSEHWSLAVVCGVIVTIIEFIMIFYASSSSSTPSSAVDGQNNDRDVEAGQPVHVQRQKEESQRIEFAQKSHVKMYAEILYWWWFVLSFFFIKQHRVTAVAFIVTFSTLPFRVLYELAMGQNAMRGIVARFIRLSFAHKIMIQVVALLAGFVVTSAGDGKP